MKLKTLIAVLGIAALGVACTDSQHYPITGEECGTEDPVQELSLQQCSPPA